MLLRQHGEWNSTIFHRCSKSPTTLGAAVRSCSHILHSLCVCSLVGKTLEGLVASTFPETVFVSAPWIPGFYPNLANIYFQWRVVLDVSSWVFTPPSMCSEVEGPGLVTAFFLVKGRILGPDITCNFKKNAFYCIYLFILCVVGEACHCGHMEVRERFVGAVLSLSHMRSRDRAQIVRLVGLCWPVSWLVPTWSFS